ncbi:histidine phosphatase family protein [Limnobacter alexandrii]|uniref:histidine phosphatase family protein n=1 Tax=Limnobacter alexandrii TaxID=2570352 RepID=UPI001108BCF3|nr:histidine phosphatase family protein [Limnobacter alexandrii]
MSSQAIDFGAIVRKKPTGTRFILVRHGETDWNKEKRFQGHTDIALNAHGLLQAQLLGKHFGSLKAQGIELYTHCVSSDLSRAYSTATIIHGSKTPAIELNAGLRERHYGHLSGLTGDEMQAKSPQEFDSLKNREPDAPLQGGESLNQFYTRVVSAFEQIRQHASPGDTILLVAHGGVLDCIYRHCTGEPIEKQREWQLPNCALNVVEIDPGGQKQVRLWAWVEHLNNDEPGQNMDEVDGRIA